MEKHFVHKSGYDDRTWPASTFSADYWWYGVNWAFRIACPVPIFHTVEYIMRFKIFTQRISNVSSISFRPMLHLWCRSISFATGSIIEVTTGLLFGFLRMSGYRTGLKYTMHLNIYQAGRCDRSRVFCSANKVESHAFTEITQRNLYKPAAYWVDFY